MFKRLLIATIIALNMSAISAFAKIIETSDASVISKEIMQLGEDDLVTFDVKGVIFTPSDQILSPSYVKRFKEALFKIESEYGKEEAQRLQTIVLLNHKPILVDEAIPSIIREAQNKKIKIVALTSGRTGILDGVITKEDLRLQTLKALGIDFSSSFKGKMLHLDADRLHGALFKDGVIFAARHSKGEVLEIFLNKVHFKPKKLLHVDNNLEKLKLLEIFCKKAGIDFLGIKYTKVYTTALLELNEEIANKKLEVLKTHNIWISDEIASCMLKTGSSIEQCKSISDNTKSTCKADS